MPTRADWEAAAPKCPKHGKLGTALVPGRRALRVGERCATPLHYDVGGSVWVCPHHGEVLARTTAAAQLAAAQSDDA